MMKNTCNLDKVSQSYIRRSIAATARELTMWSSAEMVYGTQMQLIGKTSIASFSDVITNGQMDILCAYAAKIVKACK